MDNWSPEDNRYLSSLLDGVTGTEEIVKMRQDYCRIYDCLHAKNVHPHSSHFTGSLAEGMDLPGSDEDYIFDINDYYDIGVSDSLQELAQSTQTNKFLFITDNVQPGYVLMKCANQTQNADLLNSCVMFRNATYLSSALSVSTSPALQSDQGNARTIRGPSVESWSKYLDVNNISDDNVLSIHCKFWPTSAAEWIERPRHYGWPSREDRDKIITFGCYLVPVGHKLSNMNPLEWRLSFVLAERTLVWSFNHTQMQCYAVMKLILKEFIKVHCPEEHNDVLCSYFIKTFLFWQYEKTDQSFWQSTNLRGCLQYLLNEFRKCIQTGSLRHYFIPCYNLLEVKLTREAQSKLLQFYDIVIQSDMTILAQSASLSGVWLQFLQDRGLKRMITRRACGKMKSK